MSLVALLLAVIGLLVPGLPPIASAQDSGQRELPSWVHEERQGATDPDRGPLRPPPEARGYASMAYHPDSGQTVVFGGYCASTATSDLYSHAEEAAKDAHTQAHELDDHIDSGAQPAEDEVESADPNIHSWPSGPASR